MPDRPRSRNEKSRGDQRGYQGSRPAGQGVDRSRQVDPRNRGREPDLRDRGANPIRETVDENRIRAIVDQNATPENADQNVIRAIVDSNVTREISWAPETMGLVNNVKMTARR